MDDTGLFLQETYDEYDEGHGPGQHLMAGRKEGEIK